MSQADIADSTRRALLTGAALAFMTGPAALAAFPSAAPPGPGSDIQALYARCQQARAAFDRAEAAASAGYAQPGEAARAAACNATFERWAGLENRILACRERTVADSRIQLAVLRNRMEHGDVGGDAVLRVAERLLEIRERV